MYINLQNLHNSFRTTHLHNSVTEQYSSSREPPALRRTRGANHSLSHASHALSPQCHPQRTPRRLVLDMTPTWGGATDIMWLQDI